ncbi:uncharacterized protein LOC119870474 [Canis lupus familiaris]|uniref:uncharacterized protein LOC119870474 n=1 Tax=Canis lupus familiaris TaxID=9615 RepID=UPI0018F714B5|nr:uncharacterized protein LOC119870474 [Canis lupus familiaris]
MAEGWQRHKAGPWAPCFLPPRTRCHEKTFPSQGAEPEPGLAETRRPRASFNFEATVPGFCTCRSGLGSMEMRQRYFGACLRTLLRLRGLASWAITREEIPPACLPRGPVTGIPQASLPIIKHLFCKSRAVLIPEEARGSFSLPESYGVLGDDHPALHSCCSSATLHPPAWTPPPCPAHPAHCPLALQPTCLDSSSSVRSGGRARLRSGSRHMEMAWREPEQFPPPRRQPPTGHTSGGRRRCLGMQEAGAGQRTPGKPRGQKVGLGLDVGCGSVVSAVSLTTGPVMAKQEEPTTGFRISTSGRG